MTTGAVAAERLRAIRKAQGLSLREVSERVTAAGWPLILTAIGKIENGDRRMDVDDLTALAAALGVTPATLLLPDSDDAESVVQITGVSGSADKMWGWMGGRFSAPGTPDDIVEFARRAWPAWMRRLLDQRLRTEMEAAPSWLSTALDGARPFVAEQMEEK